MPIKFFDMFSGIGGFRAALEKADGFECVGYCEINLHAQKSYNSIFDTRGEWFCDDAGTIEPSKMPGFDLLCAGFPCQSFSQAGKKRGFNDQRGTLFFEITRVAGAKQPAYLLLENVVGLLTHDQGRTFAAMLHELCKLGYSVEWQVLNSKDFGVAQSRKRLFAFCYLDERCAGKIFPILGANSQALRAIIGGKQRYRVYDSRGISCTIMGSGGGLGANTGLYFIDEKINFPE